MATIRKRGDRWQVMIRRKGAPALGKSFDTKAQATAWARDREAAIDRAEVPMNIGVLRSVTVDDLLRRYAETVSTTKRGGSVEQVRIEAMRRHPVAKVRLDQLSSAHVARYRDDRLAVVKAPTARRELAIFQHCFEIARREWGMPLPTNPVRDIAIPSAGLARERRIEGDEAQRLLEAAGKSSCWYLKPLVTLAIETGMRRGELLSLRWSDFDGPCQTIGVFRTKNGHPRIVPLTAVAVATIEALPTKEGELLFPVSPNAVRLAWERLKTRAGVEALRFHDLRHEAVSRFFEFGLSVPEVALISGHRDTRMLLRYTHLRPENVARRLAALTAADSGGIS
ncbi:MAG: site-specific integrase [Microbacteriaceae bacterium]|nr:site-specific integrase [Microbacteriaceae bacterium]